MDKNHNEEINGLSSAKSSLNPRAIIAILLMIIVVGIAALRFWRGTDRDHRAGRPVPIPDFDVDQPSSGEAVPRPGDLLITVLPERLENAHLKIEPAILQSALTEAGGLRTTGTIEPNAYKVVPVLPIAGGIVREVSFALGDKVGRGQKLATIFSTELADAQTAYLGLLAEIEKHHHRYARTAQLVEIGAASREEFEEVSANYKTEQAKLTAARHKLSLMGMTAKQIDQMNNNDQTSAQLSPPISPLISVESPQSGIILNRAVNVGEVVEVGKELFRVADLSTVWVIGQIYEKDFARIHVGTPAVINSPAFPNRTFAGRVSYIDPRVEPQTRTAQIRVEVKNPDETLKLGMFVDIGLGGSAPSVARNQTAIGIPRNAVQIIGTKQVVFVSTAQPGTFAQREVNTGPESNGNVLIYSGLSQGERVVTEGSFLLRAESLKLNPSQLTALPARTAPASSLAQSAPEDQPKGKPSQSSQGNQPQIQAVTITLTEKGYQPDKFNLKPGIPARVTFVRKTDIGCGTEIVLEEYKIKRDLPLNQPVVVEFTPTTTGEFKFACGMDMLRGKIIVR